MKRVLIIAVGLLAFGCGDSEEARVITEEDATTVLNDWADRIIIPAYEAYVSELDQLEVEIDQFVGDASVEHLQSLRSQWVEAYLALTKVELYQIGEAESTNFQSYVNSYPTDAEEILENIGGASYDLTLPSRRDQQGFPAMDYLLNGLADTDEAIVAAYADQAYADQAYADYLVEVFDRVDGLSNQVLADWKNGYREEFIANTGSTGTGALDKLANDFIFHFEKIIRTNKVSGPAGVFNVSDAAEVEAYYKNDISKDLLESSYASSKDFFYGNSFDGQSQGESLFSMLTLLDQGVLLDSIASGYSSLEAEIADLDDSFSNQIETDNIQMLEVHDAFQRQIVNFKTNMMSELNISIDFQDTDGD